MIKPEPQILKSGSHILTQSICPYCGEKIDAAVCVEGSNIKPNIGDVSVCIYCAGLLEYDMIGLLIKLKIFDDLPESTKNLLVKTQDAVKEQLKSKKV